MDCVSYKRNDTNWQRGAPHQNMLNEIGGGSRSGTGSLPKLQENQKQRQMQDSDPDVRKLPPFYLPESPSVGAKSRFTFGTAECLQSNDQKLIGEKRPGLLRSASFISRPETVSLQSNDAESIYRPVPTFGRSRRMSRSLPELRDTQFVSVLPDLEEEESEISEFEGEESVYDNKPTRLPWHRKLDFVLCSVCHSLGLSNFWRFPYYCYSNGGGSFLLAYLILLVLCGVPFLCMELAIGQLTQSGPISALGQLCPLMKGIGVASMMLSFWLTAYYSVLVAWTLFYTFNSFYSPPRWTRCTNTWNSEICREHVPGIEIFPLSDQVTKSIITSNNTLKNVTERNDSVFNFDSPSTIASFLIDTKVFNAEVVYENISQDNFEINHMNMNFTHPAVEFVNLKMLETSSGIEESGELRFELLAAVLFVWLLTYFALRKTDFFRGTTIYVLAMVSHLLLFSIFLRTIALEGAKSGFHFLFKPDWNEMTNSRVWLYALVQAFHSLGVVLGPSILMGSCHKQHNNVLRDTIVLTVVTLLTVLMISCIIFGTLGYLSLKLKKPVENVLDDDPATVFVVYSVVIGSMPLPSCWGVLFFLVILCLGLDSQIKLMATLVSALKEAYTYYIKQRFQGHSLFLAVICGVCFFATIPYLTQAGIYFFQLMDHYIAVLAVAVVALLEMCTLGWLYGAANLSSCIQQMTGKTPSYFYLFSWMVFVPVTIMVILIYSAVQMSGNVIRQSYIYPSWAHVLGWTAFALTLCWVPLLAVAAYKKAPKSHILVRLNCTIQPKIRTRNDSMWDPKPVIILNGSTVTDAEFPDYKIPELPSSANSIQSYITDRQTMLERQNDETAF